MILYYRILEFRSTKRLIAAHSLVEWATIDRNAGDQSVGATLVPIPNTIVKPYSADGTPLARARESRPSPAPHCKTPDRLVGGFVFHTLTAHDCITRTCPKLHAGLSSLSFRLLALSNA